MKVAEWMAADFANLDMAEMEKTIGRFMKTVLKAEKAFEGMKVVPVLKVLSRGLPPPTSSPYLLLLSVRPQLLLE